jgi:hypothetical protein
MKKVLRVTANTDGWYSIKASCDEGSILTNIKLEANKPLELSFINNRASIEKAPATTDGPKQNHEGRGYKNFNSGHYRRRPKTRNQEES